MTGSEFEKAAMDAFLEYKQKEGAVSIKICASIVGRLFDHVLSKEKKKKADAGMPKADRDILFDGLAAACGANPREMTATAGRACGTALAEIFKACPDVTVAEFQARALRYRTVFRDAALTPRSLCAHWAECGTGKPTAAAGTPDKQTDPYAMPTFDWIAIVCRKWPRDQFPSRDPWEEGKWSEIPVHIRKEILLLQP